jgi:hypothetical protein
MVGGQEPRNARRTGEPKMKYAACLIAGCATLAACNSSPKVNEKNASVAEVVNAVRQSGVAGDIILRAGQWRVTSTLDDMNIPNMPPQAQAQMKGVIASQRNSTYEYCLTPEEAKEPRGKFFSGKEANNCRYDHFTMGGGKIDAVMTCQSDPARSMTMTVNGSYSPDSYETHVAMNMKGGNEGNMSMKLHSEAHRIGECSAKNG